MEKILVSDGAENGSRVAYIYNAVASRLPLNSPRLKILFGGNRAAIVSDERLVTPDFKKLLFSAAAETIAVGYKYDYFSQTLQLFALTPYERQIFLCALIAADLKTDAGYVFDRLKELDTCALDGFFAFRLQALRKKWDKIIGYIPPDFSAEELERFMKYLVEGNKGSVIIGEKGIYDGEYRLCRRGALAGGDGKRFPVESEIILSCAREVHIMRKTEGATATFLKKYYGARAVFYPENRKKRLDIRGAACYNKGT